MHIWFNHFRYSIPSIKINHAASAHDTFSGWPACTCHHSDELGFQNTIHSWNTGWPLKHGSEFLVKSDLSSLYVYSSVHWSLFARYQKSTAMFNWSPSNKHFEVNRARPVIDGGSVLNCVKKNVRPNLWKKNIFGILPGWFWCFIVI